MSFRLSLAVLCTLLAHYAHADCPSAPNKPADRRTNTSVLKVGSFNAEWLFYGTQRTNCPGTGCPWTTQTMALEHMQNVSKVIRSINADILVVVEVQSCEVLTMLNTEYLDGMNYLPYLLQGTDTATGQNLGLLTRVDPTVTLQRTSSRANYPLSGSNCGYNGTKGDTGVSKHFWSTFSVTGMTKPLSIFGLHLLAFPVDKTRCAQREAQAAVIQQVLLSEAYSKGHEVIVVGDYNDYDGSVLDVSSDEPLSRVLQMLKNPAGVGQSPVFSTAASFVASANRYTSWYDKNNNCVDDGGKEHTSIDHVLLSPGLAQMVSSASTNHVFTAGCATMTSDHWPVTVTLDLAQRA
eukprot:TRINITY_DN26765_c0_g1_i1.p1 TRINITY_DN26765_c0_g1~~TRINITY_DN26765_c0_g1_i1.p1  ORF type:complete len:350 (+),score=50.23 TRINITY_DN26765_c0_g1_i1:66-1115(+)